MATMAGSPNEAAGDAETNVTCKTGDTKPQVGGQIFGGIDVTPFGREPKPAAKTFFGQNHIPDISELGLRLDDADTLEESIKPQSEITTTSLEGTRESNHTEVTGNNVDIAAIDNTACGFQYSCYYQHPDQGLEPGDEWERYEVDDYQRSELRGTRSGASIRSANSAEAVAFLDDEATEEPLVTTYSDELDSPKLTAGRSKDDCVVYEAVDIHDDPHVPSSGSFQDEGKYHGSKIRCQRDQGTNIDDLSSEQFRCQLDSYMEDDTIDHIRYSPPSYSSNGSNPILTTSTTHVHDGYVSFDEAKITDRQSDDEQDEVVDDDDEIVDVEDGMLERGLRFVTLPRSRRKQSKRRSCRYWSNAGLMVRENRGPLCLYDEQSSPPPEESTKHHGISIPPKEYIHPLLRPYNDLRGETPEWGDDKTDQGHGDRCDVYQYQKSGHELSQRKSERTRPSVYNRLRKFFKTFLRKRSSESTQTDPVPIN